VRRRAPSPRCSRNGYLPLPPNTMRRLPPPECQL
jgi:hypothetical protein